MTITPAQENERTLARLLGIGEDQAAKRLAQTVAITAGDGVAARFGMELTEQLAPTIANGVGACDIEVVIGAAPAREAPKRVFITLDADSVTLSNAAPSQIAPATDLHGLQILIGACYAASFVFARLLGGIEQAPDIDPFVIRFDALGATRTVLETPIYLADTALVGAGGVANGFLRAARYLDMRGELTVVDPKAVGKGNPNRCYYFGGGDVDCAKAERLCANAQKDFPNMKLQPKVGTFAELVKSKGRIRRAITTADSRPARRSIQKELPLEVLDASTTDVSEIIVHSHREPNPGACLACIYKHIPDELARARDIASGLGIDLEDVTSGALINEAVAQKIVSKHPGLNPEHLIGMAFDSLFKQLCAEQALLSPTGAQVLAPFAFVSNLAGALLALELARFDSGIADNEGMNYLFLSPWAPPHARVRRYRPRDLDCEFCSQPETHVVWLAVWPELEGTADEVAA
jgi:molybdopterin/thiamine biosynthesis adenylyltransferase